MLNWINLQQQEFYRALAGALKAMRTDGSKMWLLVGLSFAYGIFHAAGPGHGKAVISSYMVANEVALRRGILLSFVSAFLQGLTAIAVMMLAYSGAARHRHLDDRRDLVPRNHELCADHAVRRLAVVAQARPAAPAPVRQAGPRYSLSAAHAGHSHGGHSHAGHSHVATRHARS